MSVILFVVAIIAILYRFPVKKPRDYRWLSAFSCVMNCIIGLIAINYSSKFFIILLVAHHKFEVFVTTPC